MKTGLGPKTWAVLLAVYAATSFLLLFFTGAHVAPCLGGVGPEQDELRRQCAEQWVASRPLMDKILASPIPAIVLFVVLVAATAWVNREQPRTKG